MQVGGVGALHRAASKFSDRGCGVSGIKALQGTAAGVYRRVLWGMQVGR